MRNGVMCDRSGLARYCPFWAEGLCRFHPKCPHQMQEAVWTQGPWSTLANSMQVHGMTDVILGPELIAELERNRREREK